jgi:hypothetical protein
VSRKAALCDVGYSCFVSKNYLRSIKHRAVYG